MLSVDTALRVYEEVADKLGEEKDFEITVGDTTIKSLYEEKSIQITVGYRKITKERMIAINGAIFMEIRLNDKLAYERTKDVTLARKREILSNFIERLGEKDTISIRIFSNWKVYKYMNGVLSEKRIINYSYQNEEINFDYLLSVILDSLRHYRIDDLKAPYMIYDMIKRYVNTNISRLIMSFT